MNLTGSGYTCTASDMMYRTAVIKAQINTLTLAVSKTATVHALFIFYPMTRRTVDNDGHLAPKDSASERHKIFPHLEFSHGSKFH